MLKGQELERLVSAACRNLQSKDKIKRHYLFKRDFRNKNNDPFSDSIIISNDGRTILIECKQVKKGEKLSVGSIYHSPDQMTLNRLMRNSFSLHIYLLGFIDLSKYFIIENIDDLKHKKKSYVSVQELIDQKFQYSSNIEDLLMTYLEKLNNNQTTLKQSEMGTLV